MANTMVAFRLTPDERRALKVLAAENDKTVTDYILFILYGHTKLKERALLLANSVRQVEQNATVSESIHATQV